MLSLDARHHRCPNAIFVIIRKIKARYLIRPLFWPISVGGGIQPQWLLSLTPATQSPVAAQPPRSQEKDQSPAWLVSKTHAARNV